MEQSSCGERQHFKFDHARQCNIKVDWRHKMKKSISILLTLLFCAQIFSAPVVTITSNQLLQMQSYITQSRSTIVMLQTGITFYSNQWRESETARSNEFDRYQTSLSNQCAEMRREYNARTWRATGISAGVVFVFIVGFLAGAFSD